MVSVTIHPQKVQWNIYCERPEGFSLHSPHEHQLRGGWGLESSKPPVKLLEQTSIMLVAAEQPGLGAVGMAQGWACLTYHLGL